jgi:hypothetical protein
MDYRNLCICFQPCLRIDGFCFQFLVQDWKNCWQGCWTEKEYLEEEYRVQADGEDAESQLIANDPDDRAVSSSGSSQHHPAIPLQQQHHQQQQQQQQQKSPNLLRKDNQNGTRPATRPLVTTKGSDNASIGNRTQSSNISTEDQQSSTTTVPSEPESNRTKTDPKLPALNPLSPIKL